MRRRSVLARVLLSYVVITLSFAAVIGYSVLGQRRSVRETELMRSGYIPLTVALRDAVADQNTFNSQLNNVTEVRNPADKQVWFETHLALGRPKTFAHVRAALDRAFSTQNPEIGRQLSEEISRIESFLGGDKEILQRLFAVLKQEERLAAEQSRDQLVSRGNQALSQLLELENRVNQYLDELMGEIARRDRWTFRFLLIWAGFTVLLGVLVALYARRVLRPLAQITERANAVALGDLTPRAVVATNDEIGDLARTFEAMVEGIGRANRELLESERLATIGKMAAHVTHEVRNPLSAIALNLGLLQDELSQDSEAQALHAAIEREVERLAALTEQYLSLTREHRPRLETEELGEVVSEAMEFLERTLTRAGVRAALELEPDLPQVSIDAGQIRQVVHNLVQNARQAMPDGGRLWVRVARSPRGVCLVVEDEGSGIEPTVRARLFEPFLTTRTHGTGLGLAICRQIVEAHHGHIRCEEREPHGARFIVELPVSEAESVS